MDISAFDPVEGRVCRGGLHTLDSYTMDNLYLIFSIPGFMF